MAIRPFRSRDHPCRSVDENIGATVSTNVWRVTKEKGPGWRCHPGPSLSPFKPEQAAQVSKYSTGIQQTAILGKFEPLLKR